MPVPLHCIPPRMRSMSRISSICLAEPSQRSPAPYRDENSEVDTFRTSGVVITHRPPPEYVELNGPAGLPDHIPLPRRVLPTQCVGLYLRRKLPELIWKPRAPQR